MATKKPASDYSESSIRVLKGLEPVKQRPGMYTRTENPLHIIQEVIDNASDEALGGHCNNIGVTINVDGSITVEDVIGRVIVSGLDPDQRRTLEPNPFQGADPFYQTLTDHVQVFVANVAQGREPPVTGRDGLIGLRLAEAAIESLKSGHSVEVRAT